MSVEINFNVQEFMNKLNKSEKNAIKERVSNIVNELIAIEEKKLEKQRCNRVPCFKIPKQDNTPVKLYREPDEEDTVDKEN